MPAQREPKDRRGQLAPLERKVRKETLAQLERRGVLALLAQRVLKGVQVLRVHRVRMVLPGPRDRQGKIRMYPGLRVQMGVSDPPARLERE